MKIIVLFIFLLAISGSYNSNQTDELFEFVNSTVHKSEFLISIKYSKYFDSINTSILVDSIRQSCWKGTITVSIDSSKRKLVGDNYVFIYAKNDQCDYEKLLFIFKKKIDNEYYLSELWKIDH